MSQRAMEPTSVTHTQHRLVERRESVGAAVLYVCRVIGEDGSVLAEGHASDSRREARDDAIAKLRGLSGHAPTLL